jgi:hypothetical protein
MHKNPESTSNDIKKDLGEVFGLDVSERHCRRIRRKLGWIYHSTKYCQMIREKNKRARHAHCMRMMLTGDVLADGIFSDESTIQLERHCGKSFRKQGQTPRLAPKPKHPIKVKVK